jgi:hypothetical protein
MEGRRREGAQRVAPPPKKELNTTQDFKNGENVVLEKDVLASLM